MGAIFVGSTGVLAASQTSRFIGPFLRWLVPGIADGTVDLVVFYTRKCAHAGEYGLLAVLVLAALGGTFRWVPRVWEWPRARQALLIAAAYAVTDEVHQAFVPTRYGSPVDVLIDTAGAAAGLAAVWLGMRWIARRRPGPEGRV